MVKEGSQPLVSAAFFCPQTTAADEAYLSGLYVFLSQHRFGKVLLGYVASLADEKLWEIFASSRDEVRELSHGPKYLAILRNWAVEGISAPLAKIRSNITSLPLLAVMQIGQYLRYLEVHGISHRDFVASVQDAGGVHGYCGGLPAAMCIACAKDEEQVVVYMLTAMRILVGIGAYTEAGDEDKGAQQTLVAVRLKYEGQGEQLTARFPETYISAITGPRSISIGGPAAEVRKLYSFVTEQEGLRAQKIDLGGSAHNPANAELATELCNLCRNSTNLQLPDASLLQMPLRSNQNGERIIHESLTDELVTTLLAAKCEWFELLKNVAQDLSRSARTHHEFVVFGWLDCVTMSPFHQLRLQVTKTLAKSLISDQPLNSLEAEEQEADFNPHHFPENSIAVIGASCRLPGANNMDELWNLLANGTNCARELSTDRFDMHGSFRASQSGSFTQKRTFYGNFIDDVKSFDHNFFGISAREAANMDPQQRIMLELSFEALDDAGYLATHRRESWDNVGCFVGLVLAEYMDNTNGHAPTAYTSTGTVPAFVCGRVSHTYGWSGPSEMFNTACSSSMVAINRACKAVQSGECRMALAGGVNVISGVNNYLDLAKAGFLSPTGQCKPFDVSADGYCRADGAGLVVLKRLDQALAEGDAILGVIPGVGTNQGGLSASITVPSPTAQQALYRSVLKQAGMKGDQVTFVEAHGTGTQVGDPLEMESIRSVFGSASRKQNVFVGSIKGNVGHSEPAAGIAGLLKVLTMLQHKQIPPQANFRQLNPKIPSAEQEGVKISNMLRPWDAPFRAALVNSYGAAGSNGALLCCEMSQGQVQDTVAMAPQITFPLLITAASKTSLVENARVIGDYLSRASLGSRIGDVGFTLNQKRQRHKYFLAFKAQSTDEAAQRLRNLSQSDISELPADSKTQKPMVLAFSGQSNNTIALARSFYDSIPIFRFYLDACDFEFRKLRNESLLPFIFQHEAVDDIAALQCGIFAVQYACARCWTDAGVQPSAIIGHSLGEVTALAVSGALSLADSIRLISVRGDLIRSKWGTERGTMLALECSAEEWAEIASLVKNQSEKSHLEVACYNGPTSLVIVGTSSAVTVAETILRTVQKFQRLRFQRLNTSHGFHSILTEPILDDLSAVARSLTWNKPNIPLYTCTEYPEPDFPHSYDISRHARQAVYFSNAVRRIEETLGSCLWLEAGVDSPIMAMTKRASRESNAHIYLPIKTQGRPRAIDSITDAVACLWPAGIFLNHWAFISPGGQDQTVSKMYRKIWLPPYQFAKTHHWVDNIDRVIEMRQHMLANSEATSNPPAASASPPPPLISRRTTPASKTVCAEFLVNTQNERFRKVVAGHVVCSHPLCPAPLYLECATMALLLQFEDKGTVADQAVAGKNLVFKELRVSHPLGLDPQSEVLLRLEEALSETQGWKFSVLSNITPGKGKLASGETLHAEGVICLSADPMFDGFQRLVSGHMRRITNSSDADRLQSTRAYGLFDRVVKYDRFFKGMQSIEMEQYEAIASIKLPPNQPHRQESSATKICDAIMVDTCLHPVGLLINSHDSIVSGEVAVMVGFDRAVISPAFTMDSETRWQVYTSFNFADDQQQAVGDVFVCSPSGELVALFTSCRMTKLTVTRLERVFSVAMGSSREAEPRNSHRALPQHASESTTEAETPVIFTPSTSASTSDDGTPAVAIPDSKLADLISDCTGINSADIPQDTSLGVIGLDSLGSAELSEEISSKFDVTIDSVTLMESTLVDLQKLLGLQRPITSSKPVVPPSQAVSVSNTHEIPVVVSNVNNDVGEANGNRQKLFLILTEILGAPAEDIEPQATLTDLGIDSLSTIDLQQEIEDAFSVTIEFEVDTTVEHVMVILGIADAPRSAMDSSVLPSSENTPIRSVSSGDLSKSEIPAVVQSNPFDSLKLLDNRFDEFASKHGVAHYWSEMAPLQDAITLAYVTEGFAAIGVDLRKFSQGQLIPPVPYLSPKYEKLVRRLWEFLEKQNVVLIARGEDGTPRTFSRGPQKLPGQPASQLLQEFDSKFPAYRNESKLIGLTGPRLADCLSGKVDSVSVMFGSASSLKIMEDYYGASPISSTLTDQLAMYVTDLVRSSGAASSSRPIQILEVGGGTGGTTRWLAKALQEAGVATQYTFTDISPSLVKKGKSKFQRLYPFMEFKTFNLEEEVRPEFLGKYDIVLATNTVHATSNKTLSCRRMRETLVPDGGLMILAELTCLINWCDICFGLLDGWWLSDGPIAPLQTAQEWMDTFCEAGFASMGYSTGPSPEANTAQLLVGCTKAWKMMIPRPIAGLSIPPGRGDGKSSGYRLQPMVYKIVDGVEIQADVYYPRNPSPSPLSIALMIHGGGHMTLSRRAIRPAQTRYLLKQGYLPVSIDYRLCPEINLIEGPITDVCDAYRWARSMLPGLAAMVGVRVNPERVVAIGWSTGGQLAMSLGWTAEAAGMPRPTAVLSFYAPVDFESGELDNKRMKQLPNPQMSLGQIMAALPSQPITNCSSNGDSSDLGWIKQGDPRSELLLMLSQEGTALPVLLNGLDSGSGSGYSLNLAPPSPERIAYISPLAQLRAGRYNTPTFIIHGSNDDVAPFPAAERFVAELRERGVQHGFLPLQGAPHIFDLGVQEESKAWEETLAPGFRFLNEA